MQNIDPVGLETGTTLPVQENKTKANISFFDKYLTLWVLLCMITGGLIGMI